MTWDHNKDLHLALRALIAEAHQVASRFDKWIKWAERARDEWEQANRLSEARPNDQAHPVESQSGDASSGEFGGIWFDGPGGR
jgi:hypothetical protein